MTARIDHATQALDHIEASERYSSEDWPSQTGEHKADILALAQVHATLALAEQQRIANLIALAQGSDGALSSVTRDLAYLSIVSGGPDGSPHPDVAAALGIEAGEHR